MNEMSPLTDGFAVSLPLQQWQLIINLLGGRSYRIAAPLIAEITRQLQATRPAAVNIERRSPGLS